jgi:hypothetical protein
MQNFKDPHTPEEWRDAVDAAEAYLLLESARMYGLVRGGPVINVDRCEQLLRAGKSLGYTPHRKGVDRLIAELAKPPTAEEAAAWTERKL